MPQRFHPSVPMRIAFVSEFEPESLSQPGSNAHAMLLHALRRRGHEVIGVDCELRGWERIGVAGLLFDPSRERWRARYRLHPRAFSARSASARRQLERLGHRFDVVLQYGSAFDASIRGVPLAIWCDTTAILTRDEPFSWMSSLSASDKRLVERQERDLFGRVAQVITMSRHAKARIAEVFGLTDDRVAVSHVGVGVETAGAVSRPPDVVAAGQSLCILFVGREFTRKGGDVVLEAARRVRRQGVDARVVVIGPREPVSDEAFVDFMGFLDKGSEVDRQRLASAYRDADLFCFPTRREPFGIAVAEAMQAGLPVVASNISAIPEMVDEGETGFLVAPDDVEAVVERILRLARNPEQRLSMGLRAAERARERFSWEGVAEKVDRALVRAVHGFDAPK